MLFFLLFRNRCLFVSEAFVVTCFHISSGMHARGLEFWYLLSSLPTQTILGFYDSVFLLQPIDLHILQRSYNDLIFNNRFDYVVIFSDMFPSPVRMFPSACSMLRDPDRDWISLKHNRQNLFSESWYARTGIQRSLVQVLLQNLMSFSAFFISAERIKQRDSCCGWLHAM